MLPIKRAKFFWFFFIKKTVNLHPQRKPSPMTKYCTVTPPTRHVFLRDILVMAHIGAFESERAARQRVLITIDLGVEDTGEEERATGEESLDSVVNYALLLAGVEDMVKDEHIVLVETLAERVARFALAMDRRVQVVRVQVEKPDIFPNVGTAGVEIERRRLVHSEG
jgi:dihydroneopterin aldolase